MSEQKCVGCVSHADTRLVALSQAILRTTDPYTAHHQDQVGRLCTIIGRELGCTEVQLQNLYHAGLVHDLGKVAVPLEILNKPFRLSPEEFSLIKTHVKNSVSILQSAAFSPEVVSIIAAHHERLDGTGYPLGISADQISLETRILTVADVFETMTTHRPYRASLGIEPAMSELRTGMGTKYDADVVLALEVLVGHSSFEQLFGFD